MNPEAMTYDMVVVRVIDAAVEQVWKAWSEAEYIKQWWGPTGFTAPIAEVNFHVGGKTLVCMKAPAEFGGQSFYNTWTYTQIVPMQTIEFIQHFTDDQGNPFAPAAAGLPPGIPDEVPHIVTFKSIADNATEITVKELGYTAEDVVNLSKAGMEQCLDKMAAIFAVVNNAQ